MSLHSTFTLAERAALRAHKIPDDRPSQMSDAFVLGMRSVSQPRDVGMAAVQKILDKPCEIVDPDTVHTVEHWVGRGPDYIARTAVSMNAERFRGAMIWTIGKYCDRYGLKDSPLVEAKKIQDYANRLVEFETAQAD